ncbi:MAG: membrane protein insertase YidC [Anaerolineaceae bacterium]|nr:membrane protein insertase YidC [Anaerolineaceae bacterium]
MTVGNAFFKLLIGPLELLFETVFALAYRYIGDPGLAIICMSLIVNLLVLPLYRRADKMQADERKIEDKLQWGIDHIKKTFHGDERFMMLQAFYRENNYKPIYALRGSLALLLEIPFFIAAYKFLSELRILRGSSFGPIQDLGNPDGLLTIGGMTVNLLPILMTVINIISASIYMKGMPFKNKVQTYGLALVFLIFLYNSPSGLVLYWTLNNLFSLIKNIFYKLSDPTKILRLITIGFSAAAVCFFSYILIRRPFYPLRTKIIITGLIIFFLLLIVLLHRGKTQLNFIANHPQLNDKLFAVECLYMILLTGFLIPSAVISSAVGDFINIRYYYSPLWYVFSSFLLAVGTFAVWFGVFYKIANAPARMIFTILLGIYSVSAAINYFFFGTNRSDMSNLLVYMKPPVDSYHSIFINLLLLIFIAAVFYLIWLKKQNFLAMALIITSLAFCILSAINLFQINKNLDEIKTFTKNQLKDNPEIHLSKNGKNVVIFMMDRSIGYYIPFIMAEHPELQQKFDGFTFYPNTLSFGTRTMIALPALYGGYEYTPDKINERSDTLLRVKHNEALLMLPLIFSENDFDVTVIDPSFANYWNPPDLSIYEAYPKIRPYLADGLYSLPELLQADRNTRNRNFFCFSLYKTAPLLLQPMLYTNGFYNEPDAMAGRNAIETGFQKVTSLLTANGINANFYNAYSVLANLSSITKIDSTDNNTYLTIDNNTTHEPTLLQMPDYKMEARVNNADYEITPIIRHSSDGSILHITTPDQLTHYHINIAAYDILGQWMDYLRENEVYDNTRIIITADHGQSMGFEETVFGKEWYEDVTSFNPVLMVKDFNCHGFSVDDRFMTNADIPELAVKNLIESPVNPFSGIPLSAERKNEAFHEVQYNDQFRVEDNEGNVFFPGKWYRLQGNNIFDIHAWEYIGTY